MSTEMPLKMTFIYVPETNRANAKKYIRKEVDSAYNALEEGQYLQVNLYITEKLSRAIKNKDKYFDKIMSDYHEVLLIVDSLPDNQKGITKELIENRMEETRELAELIDIEEEVIH